MRTAGEILQGARKRRGLSVDDLAMHGIFSNKNLIAFEEGQLDDHLSGSPPDVRCLIDLYQLTPSEIRECVAFWSQADRAKVAAWDALCPLSPEEIQDLIKELEPGDKVGPFTFESLQNGVPDWGIQDRWLFSTRDPFSRHQFFCSTVTKLIQAFGGITKKEGGS